MNGHNQTKQEQEYCEWRRRKLDGTEWVYVWADVIQRDVGDQSSISIQVIIGADTSGNKSLLAFSPGKRTGTKTWQSLLLDLRNRGMNAPQVAVADGTIGFRQALAKIFPKTRFQRCWEQTLSSIQEAVSTPYTEDRNLVGFPRRNTRSDALRIIQAIVDRYQGECPDKVACLHRDQDVLLTYEEYPLTHWLSLQSTRSVERALRTVRLRPQEPECASSEAALAALWKQAQDRQLFWPALSSMNKSPDSEKILEWFKMKGVRSFFHFTEEWNADSIFQESAIYSRIALLKHNLLDDIIPGGNELSWRLDARYYNFLYVSLSHLEYPPMLHRLLSENSMGRYVSFELSLDVACIDGVTFTDRNATANRHTRVRERAGLDSIAGTWGRHAEVLVPIAVNLDEYNIGFGELERRERDF